jgi:FkbH-like protein
MSLAAESVRPTREEKRSVKCVVWDLDGTLWDGILLEDPRVSLKPCAPAILRTLDERGILQSIASKNDHDAAMEALRRFGLDEYFLYPHINWNAKSQSVAAIAKALNIGVDSLAFVDDQPFERDEVAAQVPGVLCIDATEVDRLADRPELRPRFVTDDSRLRRQMYMSDITRKEAEGQFVGPSEAFLAGLGMRFTIASATEADLMRAEELTVRTNQLNTTGYTYSYDDLNALRTSREHRLLMAGLEDRYGTYGKIGLALIQCEPSVWTIKLLLMSCRVMSRGVGTILINHVMQLARDAGVGLQAEYLPTGRNRMIYVTFKFAGFREAEKRGELGMLACDLRHVQAFPPYVEVRIEA